MIKNERISITSYIEVHSHTNNIPDLLVPVENPDSDLAPVFNLLPVALYTLGLPLVEADDDDGAPRALLCLCSFPGVN